MVSDHSTPGSSAPDVLYPVETLKQELQRGRVVLVVGAGVSAEVADLPGWGSAVKLAIDHLERVGTASPEQVATLRPQLQEAKSPSELTACAASVRELLTGSSPHSGEFAAWLQATFGISAAPFRDAPLLRSIHRLPASLITTTNYDKLLSNSTVGLEPVTWQEPNHLSMALHSGERVVHLHGVWDDPASVVFGATDYGRVTEDLAYRSFLQTLWLDRTLVFIGCSFDGMRDPDFAALLDWAAAAFPDSTARHYALVRSGTYTADEAEQFLNRWRIQLVPYGDDYEQLAPFLQSLASRTPSVAPAPPRVFSGRDQQLVDITSAIREARTVLIHGMGGIGKTSVAAKALDEIRGGQPLANHIWVEQSGSSVGDLCRVVGQALGLLDVIALAESELPLRISLALSNAKDVTIILDNPADMNVVREFARSWLPSGVAMLVTSRTRVSGFNTYVEVGPLEEASAVQVFTETAGIQNDEPLVGQICSLLEGHPLAIVLAAGRYAAGNLTLERLYSRLSEEMHRLGTLRDLDQPESPSTSVRASLAVSMEELTVDLTKTLAALAHFYADTSLELLATALELDVIECEDRVGRLISRSLVQRTRRGTLHLHQLVRDAVKERSREQSTDYDGMVEQAIRSLFMNLKGGSSEAQRSLLDELDNVVPFILSTTPDHSQVRQITAAGLAVALCTPYGLFHRYLIPSQAHSAREMLEVALQLGEKLDDVVVIVGVLQSQAGIHTANGEPQGALTALLRAQELAVSNDFDLVTLASIQCEIGNTLLTLHDYPEAERAMRAGLANVISSGKSDQRAQLTGQLGRVLLQSGKTKESKRNYLDALHLYEEQGDFAGVGACASNLADIAEIEGRHEECWSLHCESLSAEVKADNIGGAFRSLEELARRVHTQDQLEFVVLQTNEIAMHLPYFTEQAHKSMPESVKGLAFLTAGKFEEAKTHFLASLDGRRDISDYHGQAIDLGRLSETAISQKDFDQARRYNEESRSAYEAAGKAHGVAICHHNGVSIALSLDNVEAARNCACEAMRIFAQWGDLRNLVQTFRLLTEQILTRQDEEISILTPPDEMEFRDLMDLVAIAAQQRDLGLLVGATLTLMQRFGPGGVSRVA